jgi:hypothetical protein
MISFEVFTSGDMSGGLMTERAVKAATYAIWVLMRKRIFFEGLKADGTPIGTYSPKYLEYRQKPPYNRTSDPKKILVLTDSLRLNFVYEVINDSTAVIGINGRFNYYKAQKNDPNNEIFIPSQEELRAATDAALNGFLL